MTQSAEQILGVAELYSDDAEYRILRLPANAITLGAGVVAEANLPFSVLIADKDELTLLLPEAACTAFSRRLRYAQVSEQTYRLITFDAELEPTLVGFIAQVSAALAAAGIPILSFAAFSRDHIFVPAEDFPRALDALRALQERLEQG